MCTVFNREDLISDDRFATAKARAMHRPERLKIMSDEILKWSSNELLKRFQEEGVPCAPILTRREILDDPQVIENQIFDVFNSEHLGKIRQPRPAARFNVSPSEVRSMAPLLGEDNTDILSELGYGSEEVAKLEQTNIIRSVKNEITEG